MKLFKKVAVLSVLSAATIAGLGACKSVAKRPVTFVPVTSSTYNADVTIGDYTYNFGGRIKGNQFVLEAKTLQRGSSGSGGQGGGPGGGGFPGGGFGPGGGQQGGGQQAATVESITLSADNLTPFINQSVKITSTILPEEAKNANLTWTSSDESIATVSSGTVSPKAEGKVTITASSGEVSDSLEFTVFKENLPAHDFVIKGECKLDKGYGYVITIGDEVIHTDFDKVAGRHEFYYNVTNKEGVTSQVLFQAKDSAFKDQLAADYKKWDERDSKYIFYSKATGNNNSVATAYLYLHNNNTAVLNYPSGADRKVTTGLTWEEVDGKITLIDGQNRYESRSSVNPEHPGKKLIYGSYSFLMSENPSIKWKNLTKADFDGETQFEFKGSYTTTGPDGGEKTLELNLGVDHNAFLYDGETVSAQGTWALTGEHLAVTLGDKVLESDKDGEGKYSSLVYQIKVSSFFGESTYDVNFVQTK